MHNDTSLMRRPYSLTAQWPGTIPFGDFTYKTGVDRDPCCYAQIYLGAVICGATERSRFGRNTTYRALTVINYEVMCLLRTSNNDTNAMTSTTPEIWAP